MINFNNHLVKKKDIGQFFTPNNISNKLICKTLDYFKLIEPNLQQITILEPSVGKGVFIKNLLQNLQINDFSFEIIGFEIDTDILETCSNNIRENLIQNGVKITLVNEDFLIQEKKRFSNKIDLIIGNPPYGVSYTPKQLELINSRFENDFEYQGRYESSILFTLKSLDLLFPNGICCLILPKPIIYSKRWSIFREILLHYKLLEVLDLGNQFTGQLQEQCVLIIQKSYEKDYFYKTGYWEQSISQFVVESSINNKYAKQLDNFLVGLTSEELNLITKVTKNSRKLPINAFRGINSIYRVKKGKIPLVEKSIIKNGFLAPEKHFVDDEIPLKVVKRQKQRKILAQRILSYQTKPKFKLLTKIWVDTEGQIITHETVINIILLKPENGLNVYNLAGLLQSEFVRWWLQHAVFTKRFVTSKDLDRSYLQSILIPIFNTKKVDKYKRKQIKEDIKELKLEILKKMIDTSSVHEKFFLLGEIYKIFQNTGDKLRFEILANFHEASQYQMFNQIYNKLKKGMVLTQISTEKQLYIQSLFNELSKYQKFIDETVFSIYNLSPEEISLILGINDG